MEHYLWKITLFYFILNIQFSRQFTTSTAYGHSFSNVSTFKQTSIHHKYALQCLPYDNSVAMICTTQSRVIGAVRGAHSQLWGTNIPVWSPYAPSKYNKRFGTAAISDPNVCFTGRKNAYMPNEINLRK